MKASPTRSVSSACSSPSSRFRKSTDAMAESVIHVLYVDDDAALVRLVQKTLGRGGFRVAHAASGEEALSTIAESLIDVIALDHYLPTGTGLDLLSRLASVSGSPPVVYVTGSTDMDVR